MIVPSRSTAHAGETAYHGNRPPSSPSLQVRAGSPAFQPSTNPELCIVQQFDVPSWCALVSRKVSKSLRR